MEFTFKEIAGKIPEKESIKAKCWALVMNYEPVNKETGMFDLPGAIKVIATVYNVSEDDVSEALAVSEVMPTVIDCVRFVNALVDDKLNKVTVKNAVTDSRD